MQQTYRVQYFAQIVLRSKDIQHTKTYMIFDKQRLIQPESNMPQTKVNLLRMSTKSIQYQTLCSR